MQPHDLWIEDIDNVITRERVKRKTLKEYLVGDEICYGTQEVYNKLCDMDYELTFNQVNHLLNHRRLSESNRKKYPELDPDNPEGIIKPRSRGQFYDRWINHKSVARFVLTYYFENDSHTRFYGVSNRTMDTIYNDLSNMMRYWKIKDNDISHYAFHSLEVIEINGHIKKAYDYIDKAIYDYLVDNPDYEAYNIDLMGYL